MLVLSAAVVIVGLLVAAPWSSTLVLGPSAAVVIVGLLVAAPSSPPVTDPDRALPAPELLGPELVVTGLTEPD